jgi:uncharacterized protein (DUF302 family)
MPAEDGLITIASQHSVTATLNRLETSLKAKAITVFARIDHGGGARSLGTELRPTELLIFGDPRAGTPLMQANQTIGLDLPLKVLAWQDAEAKVWVTYTDIAWLARRHRLGPETAAAVSALATALAKLTEAAAA